MFLFFCPCSKNTASGWADVALQSDFQVDFCYRVDGFCEGFLKFSCASSTPCSVTLADGTSKKTYALTVTEEGSLRKFNYQDTVFAFPGGSMDTFLKIRPVLNQTAGTWVLAN